MKKWRLIDTAVANAPWNMAVDEALLRHSDSALPILRLYGWETSLSFGRFSKIDKLIDHEQLQKISCSRRMSGGGVLMHGGDISYTLILPREALCELGVKKSYEYLCQFLIHFYTTLGLDANFAKFGSGALNPPFDEAKAVVSSKIQKSALCLNSNEAYDIMVANQKLGGNAQRYTQRALLQHGSIPLKWDRDIFEPLFLEEKSKAVQTLTSLGIQKSTHELKSLLIDSFAKTFECELVEDSLSHKEQLEAQQLHENKYNTKSWNIDGKSNH